MQIPELELQKRAQQVARAEVISKVETDPGDEAVAFQLKKSIAVHLKSRGRSFFTQQFLDMLSCLATEYLHNLCVGLRADMELQRRHLPSLADIEVLFRCQGIRTLSIYEEALLTKKIYKYIKYDVDRISKEAQKIITKLNDAEYQVDEDNPSYLFFTNECYEIALLVPSQTRRPSYIPEYFPELPPDYTFQHTPEYLNTITDLKRLRINLVEESRVAEKLLYNLIEDDNTEWKTQPEGESELLNSQPGTPSDHGFSLASSNFKEEKQEDLQSEGIEGNMLTSIDLLEGAVSSQKFDIVRYSALRQNISERRRKKIEERRRRRQENPFMRMEKYYLPYAAYNHTFETTAEFDEMVTAGFHQIIKQVRSHHASQRKQLDDIVKKKDQIVQQRQAERDKLDFAFNFLSNGYHLLDLEDEFADYFDNVRSATSNTQSAQFGTIDDGKPQSAEQTSVLAGSYENVTKSGEELTIEHKEATV